MKKIVFYISVLVISIAFVFLMIRSYKIIDKQVIGKSICNTCTVVIDAGHGGEDGGAVSKDGTLEKEINLAISQKLQRLLVISGFNVKMIRDDDISIYSEGMDTIRKRKVSDLKNRLSIANENENNIIISIHQNKFTQAKYSGTQVFYSKNNAKSEDLANCIKSSIVGLLQPQNKRETKPATKDIYILYNCNNVAVMVECGFLSNPEENQKLKDNKYQNEIAFSIYCGFMEFMKR